jgi:hypothetical protein
MRNWEAIPRYLISRLHVDLAIIIIYINIFSKKYTRKSISFFWLIFNKYDKILTVQIKNNFNIFYGKCKKTRHFIGTDQLAV